MPRHSPVPNPVRARNITARGTCTTRSSGPHPLPDGNRGEAVAVMSAPMTA